MAADKRPEPLPIAIDRSRYVSGWDFGDEFEFDPEDRLIHLRIGDGLQRDWPSGSIRVRPRWSSSTIDKWFLFIGLVVAFFLGLLVMAVWSATIGFTVWSVGAVLLVLAFLAGWWLRHWW
mgnify:CR=1 FL=1